MLIRVNNDWVPAFGKAIFIAYHHIHHQHNYF